MVTLKLTKLAVVALIALVLSHHVAEADSARRALGYYRSSPSGGSSGSSPSGGSSGSSPSGGSYGSSPKSGGYGSSPSGGSYGSSPKSGGSYGSSPSSGGYGSSSPSSGGSYGSSPSSGGGYGSSPSSGGGYGSSPSNGGGYGSSPSNGGGYGSSPSGGYGKGTPKYWCGHPEGVPKFLSLLTNIAKIFGPRILSGIRGLEDKHKPSSGLTLFGALKEQSTDPMGSLMREGSASLINSYAYSGEFPLTTTEVVARFNNALDSPELASRQAIQFQEFNEKI